MVGEENEPVNQSAPNMTTLAQENDWAHVGGHGAEHYVKMVHKALSII